MREASLPELVGALRCEWEVLLEGMVSAGVAYTWPDLVSKRDAGRGKRWRKRGWNLTRARKEPVPKENSKLSHARRAHQADTSQNSVLPGGREREETQRVSCVQKSKSSKRRAGGTLNLTRGGGGNDDAYWCKCRVRYGYIPQGPLAGGTSGPSDSAEEKTIIMMPILSRCALLWTKGVADSLPPRARAVSFRIALDSVFFSPLAAAAGYFCNDIRAR